MSPQSMVQIRRVYDDPTPKDGHRVLVDRLWPRGVAKAALALDEWAKEIAPSTELRKWYGHEPERFEEFAERYRAELDRPEWQRHVQHLHEIAGAGPLTLLTATKQLELSAAEVLRAYLN
jgi:uncharacterized protein YeaO (DUF488 family)